MCTLICKMLDYEKWKKEYFSFVGQLPYVAILSFLILSKQKWKWHLQYWQYCSIIPHYGNMSQMTFDAFYWFIQTDCLLELLDISSSFLYKLIRNLRMNSHFNIWSYRLYVTIIVIKSMKPIKSFNWICDIKCILHHVKINTITCVISS